MRTALAVGVVTLLTFAAQAEEVFVPIPAGKVRLEMSAVTLGDDCGDAMPDGAKQDAAAPHAKMKAEARRCEQTSMQLLVSAGEGKEPFAIKVKSVELFDEAGKSLGMLAARPPTVWSQPTGTYVTWDERIAPKAALKVSYRLSQPKWSNVSDRRGKTYLLKAVFSVGSETQAVVREVRVDAPAALPANVKT